MRLYVIRHGETEYNEKSLLQGQTDAELNALGRRVAVLTGDAMKKEGIRFDGCVSSPLMRAVHTAEILLERIGQKDLPILRDRRIIEMCIGDWEGKSVLAGASDVDPELMERFKHDPIGMPRIPNGETTEEVIARTREFLDRFPDEHPDGTWLVSTHGFAVRAMLNSLFPDPSDFWQGSVPLNCAVSILDLENGKWKISAFDRLYYDRSLAVDRYSGNA